MKKFITKVYLYDSSKQDYKGTEYSDKVMLADSNIDNLDDTLDTYEMTLLGLNFREEFDPSTKFIIAKWQQETYEEDGEEKVDEQLIETWDFIVQSDTVEQPIISEDGYFNHHLTLIEAGAEAQHRLVDNISVTYKLQDVSLDQVPTYDPNQKINYTLLNADFPRPSNEPNYGYHSEGFWLKQSIWGHKFIWQMPTWYQSEQVQFDTNFTSWKEFLYNQTIPQDGSTKDVYLPIPNLACYGPTNGSSTLNYFNGFCSIDVIVNKLQNNQIVDTDKYQLNPNGTILQEGAWNYDFWKPVGIEQKGRITSAVPQETPRNNGFPSMVAEFGTNSNGIPQGQVTFTTLSNRVLKISIEYGFEYNIILNRHKFEKPDSNISYRNWEYPLVYQNNYSKWLASDNITKETTNEYPIIKTNFVVYKEGAKGEILFQSAPPATAYDLFNKCQIASSTIEKRQGVSIDETDKLFYLSEEDKSELQNTTIIENFYNQKNLWELFMDIGKYIHARPKVVFGENGKLRVDWKRYGLTRQYEDNSQPLSVFNSKFIEEYISSVSSYVTNMVQLGGSITELIAPKSNSEDYLVYNDVAELLTSKPIIELIELVAIDSNGRERYLATNDFNKLIAGERKYGYIFEENIWKILDDTTSTNINKGNSIYYQLGTNKIQGLNYRLPSRNNTNDYAIKVILGELFAIPSTNIKVNDYTFRITYRTKDTLRTDVSRPDLRKYLLNSKYDKVPTHQQFNNQQDVVVDSEKFGNNLFGTLVRTGNSVYTRIEWVDDLTKLKHSGELYDIYGNLYYVSKVKNTYYDNYVISEVEFTKDFNRLSQIIGIPSEPRFYEISEQSSIDREISINDYMVVITGEETEGNYFRVYYDNIFETKVAPGSWWMTSPGHQYLLKLISGLTGRFSYYPDLSVNSQTSGIYYKPMPDFTFSEVQLPRDYEEGVDYYVKLKEDFPKYAISIFKGDINKNNNFKKAIISPVSTYTVGTTLTMEWDMVDNFSAGDKVIPTNDYLESQNPTNTAYSRLQAVCYTDTMGRADLLDFAIIPDLYLSDKTALEKNNIVRNFPECPESLIKFNDDGSIANDKIVALFGNEEFGKYGTNDKGIGLLKDNREIVKINYNVQMITDSDRFVLSSYLWQPNKGSLKLALLNEEVNKLSTNTIKLGNNVLQTFDITIDNFYEDLELNTLLRRVDLTNVKSIVIYSSNIINQNENTEEHYFVIARNVDGLPNDFTDNGKGATWKIRRPRKTLFTKKQ